jgi:hypothetical protein
MNSIITKSVLGGLAAASLMLAAGVASAAKPIAGSGVAEGACGVFADGSLFQAACTVNQAVANGDMGQGAYTGSCTGGAACADSVFNKLKSAASKFAEPKIADGCANLASIQSDLTTWNTAAKPKIDNTGYANMSAAITAIQAGNCY